MNSHVYDRKNIKLKKNTLNLCVTTTHGSNYNIMTMKHIGELNVVKNIEAKNIA